MYPLLKKHKVKDSACNKIWPISGVKLYDTVIYRNDDDFSFRFLIIWCMKFIPNSSRNSEMRIFLISKKKIQKISIHFAEIFENVLIPTVDVDVWSRQYLARSFSLLPKRLIWPDLSFFISKSYMITCFLPCSYTLLQTSSATDSFNSN